MIDMPLERELSDERRDLPPEARQFYDLLCRRRRAAEPWASTEDKAWWMDRIRSLLGESDRSIK